MIQNTITSAISKIDVFSNVVCSDIEHRYEFARVIPNIAANVISKIEITLLME